MDRAALDRYQARLADLRQELLALSESAKESCRPVELDQQSVGRLSRQDALQQQAMANAQEARRAAQLRKIDAALARMNDGEFGYCTACGEEIAAKRLDLDPTAAMCTVCAAAA